MQKIDNEKLKSLQSRLQKRFDYTHNLENEKMFFINTAEYMQFVNKSDYLKAIIKAFILKDREELAKEVNKISDKSIKDTKQTFSKINQLIKKNKIDNPSVKYNIEEYTKILTGKTIRHSSFGNLATFLIDEVREVLIALDANGYKEISDKFRIFDNHNSPQGWKISKFEDELMAVLNKQKRQDNIAVWSDLDALNLAYDAVYNQDELWKSMNPSERFGYGGFFFEMNLILEGKTEKKDWHYFKKEEFKNHLHNLHNKLDEEMENLILANDDEKPKEINKTEESENWYCPESGVGFINGKKFTFKEGRNKYKFFNKLIEKKKLKRADILEVLELQAESLAKPSIKTLNTYEINEIIKELRKTTKLNTAELANNGGNITLLAKIKINHLTSPKTT